MKVVGFYYLSYPDDCPVDPTVTATELWVEVGEERDTFEHHQGTYSFQVCTFGYVQREFIDQNKPLVGRSVMLVPTLADDWMSDFLAANVDSLPRWGELK